MKVNERTSAEKGRITTLSKKTKEELIEVVLKKEKTIAARDKKINWLDSKLYAAIDENEKLHSELTDLTETNTRLIKVNENETKQKIQYKTLLDDAIIAAQKAKDINDEALATIEKYENAIEVYKTDISATNHTLKDLNERVDSLNKDHEAEVSAYLSQIEYQAKNIKTLKRMIGAEVVIILLLFLSFIR